MASVIHKMKKGRPYYYAVELARLEGKSRTVWQKYQARSRRSCHGQKETKGVPPRPNYAVRLQ
jgi:hypothetical protein